MRRMKLSVPAVACMCLWLMGCAVGLDATPTIPSPTSVPAPTLSVTTAPTAHTATAPAATAVNTPTSFPPHPTATLVPPTAVPTATRRPFSPNDRVLFYREGSLWTSDLSGASVTRLKGPGFLGADPIEDSARVFTPRVSPNGRYLTTLSRGKGSWLVSTDGREERLIAICTPDRMSRLSVEIFDTQKELWVGGGKVFDLPGADEIFVTQDGDNLIFETRLEDETETIIWHASLDPLSKARRIGRGMLFDVFRLR